MSRSTSFAHRLAGLGLLIALASACTAPRQDPADFHGRQAILDAVDRALSKGDCEAALAQIEDLYDSPHSNNYIRLTRAASHACNARVNFFRLLGDLASNDITPPGLWRTLSKLFPSTVLDSRVASGWYATDALMATRKPGSVVEPSYMVNANTHNEGSILASHRLDDANAYLIFLSMATIGAIQSRYSEVDPVTFEKTKDLGDSDTRPLGWTRGAAMDTEGCSYASAVQNMIASIDAISTSFSPALASSLQNISNSLSSGMDAACAAGCAQCVADGHVSISCSVCPISLRNRNSCVVTSGEPNVAACAAAGLIRFINEDATIGYGPDGDGD